MENVEFFDMCMCIVFAFQLIRAKEVRIDIEVKRSEEKWREVMTCDVSPVAMFPYSGDKKIKLWCKRSKTFDGSRSSF